ncbi:FHA domain-containing protein, partial [Nocardioides sp. ChNu-99]
PQPGRRRRDPSAAPQGPTPPTVATPAVPPAPAPQQRPVAPPTSRHAVQPPGRSATWRVTFDSGESFVVTGLGLVGRRPEPRGGEEVAHLVPLSSSDMSVSKTHAQFHLSADGALVVMDRGSTNGSFINRGGVARELSPGRAATLVDGDVVRFGDREMRVAREG